MSYRRTWTTKEVTKMACEQSEIVNKGMKIVGKKNLIEIPELKSAITKLKRVIKVVHQKTSAGGTKNKST